MPPKTTSIFLCVLLSSTFAHEWFWRQQHLPETRHLGSANQQHHQLAETRSSSPGETCEFICDGINSNKSLSIIVNETTNIIAIVNTTAKVAIVIDINANLVGLLNGHTGDVVVINIETQVGVYITIKQSSTIIWVASKQDFSNYFKALVTLKVAFDVHGSHKFKISEIDDTVLKVIGSVLIHLSGEFSIQIQESPKAALKIVIDITTSLTTILRGSLKGILKLIGKELIAISGDITWFIHVLQGLGELFASVEGGLDVLIKKGVVLDFKILLAESDGLLLFINLLLQIGAKINLAIFKHVLNDVKLLLSIIVKLGGSESVGVTGIINIVYNIILLIHGSIKIDVLLKLLIEFAASKSTDIDISVQFSGLLEVIRIQNSTYHSEELKIFVKIVTDIHENKLVVGGVHISTILGILAKGVVKEGVDLIVAVLVTLESVLKLTVSIPALILQLITYLNTKSGVQLVESNIADLHISVNINGGDILKQILSGKTIIQLLTGGGSISSILSKLPIIGKIHTAISVSLKAHGSISIDKILNSSDANSTLKQILDFLIKIVKGSSPVGTFPPWGGWSGWGSWGGHGPVVHYTPKVIERTESWSWHSRKGQQSQHENSKE